MKSLRLFATLVFVVPIRTSENIFSVHDDVLAFPQFDIAFSESYVTIEQAREKLKGLDVEKHPVSSWDEDIPGQLARFKGQEAEIRNIKNGDREAAEEEYLSMILHGTPYLCTIPKVKQIEENTTASGRGTEQDTDLATAADRGWELLQDMEGKPCLYYSTGWWSYSFCYNSVVKQFHSLPPGAIGGKIWPPIEDPSTPSYVLGKFEKKSSGERKSSEEGSTRQGIGELQTKAETSYLVQRLNGGTACDLTGKPRQVEVQFHCNPQATDRIGWIKETATCSYMMVVYTPRLCNDAAFVPPKDSHVNTISCQQILQPDEVADWEKRKNAEASRRMIGEGEKQQRVMLGSIEVGGMRQVGSGGKKIERGRVVLTPEERAEIVVMQKDGQVQGLSTADLKKLDLNPDDVDKFTKELQEIAGAKDWKIERLDDVDGNIQLRGIVANEGTKLSGKAGDGAAAAAAAEGAGEDGTEEEYKEDI